MNMNQIIEILRDGGFDVSDHGAGHNMVKFSNGYEMSISYADGNYCSNRHALGPRDFGLSHNGEIAFHSPEQDFLDFYGSDGGVRGYVSADEILGIVIGIKMAFAAVK